MHKIFVAGIGTEIGKTVVSGILVHLFNGNYWKPVECGDGNNSDTAIMKTYVDLKKHHVFTPAYSFPHPVSPHQAAALEKITIDPDRIAIPKSEKILIIEGVGGILVPLTNQITTLDLFKSWDCRWIIVSKNYLGSINHTLLTLEVLKRNGIPILGLIFNGAPNHGAESAIMEISQVPLLGRVLPEETIDSSVLQKYATQWKIQFQSLNLC